MCESVLAQFPRGVRILTDAPGVFRRVRARCVHGVRIHVRQRGQSDITTDCPRAPFRLVTCTWRASMAARAPLGADIRRPCDMHTARRAYRLHHGILVSTISYLRPCSMACSYSPIPSCDGHACEPRKKWFLGCPAGADDGDGVGCRAAWPSLMHISKPPAPYFPSHIARMPARCTFHAILHAVLACLAGAVRTGPNRPTLPPPAWSAVAHG